MISEVKYSDEFGKAFKLLKKRYKSLPDDFKALLSSLIENPYQGDALSDGMRKVRMSITSKGKGKSGGARVITYSINQQSDNLITLTLLTIYDKSEISNLKENFVNWLIQQVTASDL